MSTTKPACPAITLKGEGSPQKVYSTRKFIPLYCVALVFAVFFNVSPANARLWTTLSGTEVTVTKNSFEARITGGVCNEVFEEFYYIQRVVIDGKTEMAAVDAVFPDVGTYTLTLLAQCGEYNLYGVGSCACITTNFHVVVPTLDLKTSSGCVKDSPEEIISREHNELVRSTSVGSLWIRKNNA